MPWYWIEACTAAVPACVCCDLQVIERVQINDTTDVMGGNVTFVPTNITVTNANLDPLLFLNCPPSVSKDPTGQKCPAYRDVSQVLPGTRTRFRFKTGKKAGLFVWHW